LKKCEGPIPDDGAIATTTTTTTTTPHDATWHRDDMSTTTTSTTSTTTPSRRRTTPGAFERSEKAKAGDDSLLKLREFAPLRLPFAQLEKPEEVIHGE